MLPDIEILDVMQGTNHFSDIERDESLNSNLDRRPKSATSNVLENDHENTHMNSKITNPGNCVESDQNSAIANSSAEINRLSSELNSRLSRELDEMMGSVNTQIQKAFSDGISIQILPHIQIALSAGSGHLTHNRWNVPSERPEFSPEEAYGEKIKKNTRCEQRNGYQSGSQPNFRAYDS